MLMPLMRNETARAFLLTQFLSKDDADAILDMHTLTATFGCGPRTNPRRKAWKRLVGLARNLTERKT
jgi:predicted deacylase